MFFGLLWTHLQEGILKITVPSGSSGKPGHPSFSFWHTILLGMPRWSTTILKLMFCFGSYLKSWPACLFYLPAGFYLSLLLFSFDLVFWITFLFRKENAACLGVVEVFIFHLHLFWTFTTLQRLFFQNSFLSWIETSASLLWGISSQSQRSFTRATMYQITYN